MLIVPVKENDSIEKALKKFKKKVEKTGMIRALRTRQAFEKPSVTKRQQIIKAKYRDRMLRENTL
jgi:small subunit ribosomal protein S21